MANDRNLFGKLNYAQPISTYVGNLDLSEPLKTLETPINTIDDFQGDQIQAINTEKDLGYQQRYRDFQQESIDSIANEDLYLAASKVNKLANQTKLLKENSNTPEGRTHYNALAKQEHLKNLQKQKLNPAEIQYGTLMDDADYERRGGAGEEIGGTFIPNEYSTRFSAFEYDPNLEQSILNDAEKGWNADSYKEAYAKALKSGYIAEGFDENEIVKGEEVEQLAKYRLLNNPDWRKRKEFEIRSQAVSQALSQGATAKQAGYFGIDVPQDYINSELEKLAGKTAGFSGTKVGYIKHDEDRGLKADRAQMQEKELYEGYGTEKIENYGAVLSTNTIGKNTAEVKNTITNRKNNIGKIDQYIKSIVEDIDPSSKTLTHTLDPDKFLSYEDFKNTYGNLFSKTKLNNLYNSYSDANLDYQIAKQFDEEVTNDAYKSLGISKKDQEDLIDLKGKYQTIKDTYSSKLTHAQESSRDFVDENILIKSWLKEEGREEELQNVNNYLALEDKFEDVENQKTKEIQKDWRQNISTGDKAISYTYRNPDGTIDKAKTKEVTEKITRSLDSLGDFANKKVIADNNFLGGKNAQTLEEYLYKTRGIVGDVKFDTDKSLDITNFPVKEKDISTANYAIKIDYNGKDKDGRPVSGSVLVPTNEVSSPEIDDYLSTPSFNVQNAWLKGATSGLKTFDLTNEFRKYYPTDKNYKVKYKKTTEGRKADDIYEYDSNGDLLKIYDPSEFKKTLQDLDKLYK